MTTAAIAPLNETERLAALHSYEILDTAADERFDRLTTLAADLFDMPVALISLVDAERQWFKSRHGLNMQETPRDIAFCGHAILQDAPFIVEDALIHPLFCNNPLVLDEPYVRFYAGFPLVSDTGHRLGTFCVIDRRPRQLTTRQISQLVKMAAVVADELEFHKARILAERHAEQQAQANSLKSAFLASMNHEFRTPLNAILGFSQVLRMNPAGNLGADQLDYITAIENGGKTLVQLTDGIMTMAQLEAQSMKIVHEPVHAGELIAEAFDLHGPSARLHGVTLLQEAGDDAPVFHGDYNHLLRIIGNFLSNAFKFTPAQGHVALGWRQEADAVLLYVSDTGCGIPASRQSEAFQSFNRLGREGSTVAGTGLGLAIARRLTQAMGGEIGFESRENAGSRFWVRFPIAA